MGAKNMKKNNQHEVVVSIDSRSVIRVILLVVGAVALITFIKNISQILILIFISFFLALALNPAVFWISDKLKSKSRVRATGAAYVLVITFLVGFFALVFPPLVKQTVDFIKEVPGTIQEVKREGSAFNQFIQKNQLDDEVDQFSSDFGERFKGLGKPALATAGAIGSAVVGLITVLVLTFMMLVEGPMWLRRIFDAVPVSKRKHREDLANRMYKVVVGFVNGQAIVAIIGGTFAAIALFILGQIFNAPINAIALGGIIALFALLPLIGTIIGSIIAVLACLLVSAPLAIAAAVYFIIYQQIENVTIQPYIQARSNGLTPLTVLLSALVGVGLGGILGALIAIPAAGCVKILLEDYFRHKHINKSSETA